MDHCGDLRGGDYIATIKIQEEHGDRWHHFQDTRVTEVRLITFSLLILKHAPKSLCCTITCMPYSGKTDPVMLDYFFPSSACPSAIPAG